jgi:peptide chain release factor subunit 1
MISLNIPAGTVVSRVTKLLQEEYGTAANIRARVNRLAVQSAILSAQQKMKLYTKIPPNGLVLYCGIVLTDEGKEKRVNIDFEPFKPIPTFFYYCDNKFHTEVI